MSDVDNQLEKLQAKLAAKTREIEMLVAEERHLSDPKAMQTSDYTRIRSYVEELIYEWQEAVVRGAEPNADTALNRLIAEREEIEQQIVELQVR